jgi:hypothetical protein
VEFIADGKAMILLTCLKVGNKVDRNSLKIIKGFNVTSTIKEKARYEITKAFQTAFSKSNDYLFYKLEIVKNQLALSATNCKNNKVDYYGILGKKSKNQTF